MAKTTRRWLTDDERARRRAQDRERLERAARELLGVIERYHGAIKIEQLWRQLPADGTEMTNMVEQFRQLYNRIRPHETLAGDRPIERYLSALDLETPEPLTATAPTRQTLREEAGDAATIASMMRRWLNLIVLLAALAGVLATPEHASAAPSVTLSLPGGTSIPLSWSSGHTLPPSWLGLSFEYGELPVKDAGARAVFRNLIGSLTVSDDGPLSLRVGGDSADTLGLNRMPNGQIAMCTGKPGDNYNGNNAPFVKANSSLATQWTAGLNDLNDPAKAPGALAGRAAWPPSTLLATNYQSRFNNVRPPCISNNPNHSVGDASYAFAGSLPGFAGWELGNEPDAHYHRKHGGDKGSYDPDLQTFGTKVHAAMGANVPIAGPALADPSGCQARRGTRRKGIKWLRDAASHGATLVTGHTYGKDPRHTYGKDPKHKKSVHAGISKLLSEDDTTGLVNTCVGPPVTASGLTPYRVDEFNSMAHRGTAGVTNSFASALWMTDGLLSMLNMHHQYWPAGVNVHVRELPDPGSGSGAADGNAANSPFDIMDVGQIRDPRTHATVTSPARPALRPKAALYGMLMAVCALDATSSWCNAEPASAGSQAAFIRLNYNKAPANGLKAFVVRVGNGNVGSGTNEMRVLFINKGSSDQKATINTGNGTPKLSRFFALSNTPAGAAGNIGNVDGSAIHFVSGSNTAQIPRTGVMPQVNQNCTGGCGTNHFAITVHGYTEELVTIGW